jgi:hypothetical protein
MSATELRSWMKKHDVTEVDIAAALKIHPVTVQRYLKGKSVHRSTKAALERYVAEQNIALTNRKVAVG